MNRLEYFLYGFLTPEKSVFFFKIRQEKGLWIVQCRRLDFVKLMSKNSISVLWWRLVRAYYVQPSMVRAGQLRATVNSGCRDMVNSMYSNMCKNLTTVVPGQRSSQPRAVSLFGCECVGWRGVNAGSYRQAGRLMHDFQTDLCMIFRPTYAWFYRLTCAWFFRLTYAWFSAEICLIFMPTYAWFFRLTYAWFYGWLMHDFPADLCMIFPAELCMIFLADLIWLT
jgi:hypothetical protein